MIPLTILRSMAVIQNLFSAVDNKVTRNTYRCRLKRATDHLRLDLEKLLGLADNQPEQLSASLKELMVREVLRNPSSKGLRVADGLTR